MLALRFERQDTLTVDPLKVAAAADYRVVNDIEGINLTSSSNYSYWLCVSSLPAQVLLVRESEPLVMVFSCQCCSIQILLSKAWGCSSQPNRLSARGMRPVDGEHERRGHRETETTRFGVQAHSGRCPEPSPERQEGSAMASCEIFSRGFACCSVIEPQRSHERQHEA